ncbi:hypothetical protein NEMBOFW57_007794 [Staphylotrichum longicolle]|uniref:Uncharacterized protein n=1 Tax=Staphylotrichum longicolle TaxID=669026 RepID=A0AAD4EZT4_9PEZI|nr:hypothetical protein NEMBOFW57_007794 [Staphylotrichum longicolle]
MAELSIAHVAGLISLGVFIVSNFFDIQWRQYGRTATDFNIRLGNGSEYLVGEYNGILSFFWDEGFHVVEATIKTVTFTLDGNGNGNGNGKSNPGLSSLAVTSITPKAYSSLSSAPLWGIEDSGLKLFQIKPIWGLLSSGYSHMPNVSTVQKSELYLVGMGDSTYSPYFGNKGMSTADNIPAANFPFIGLNTVYYHLDSIINSGLPDYLGRSSLGSMAKWQSRVTSASDAASMLNSIWADITAAAVVGTKGAHDVDGLKIGVRPVVHRIKFHMAFAVPAFLVLAASLAVLVAAAVMSVLPGGSSLRALRVNLKRTAVGRALALLTADGPEAAEGAFILGEREWSLRNGPKEVEFDPPTTVPIQSITSQEAPQKSASPEQGQSPVVVVAEEAPFVA